MVIDYRDSCASPELRLVVDDFGDLVFIGSTAVGQAFYFVVGMTIPQCVECMINGRRRDTN